MSNVDGLWFSVFGKNQLFRQPTTNNQQPTTNNFILRDLTPILLNYILTSHLKINPFDIIEQTDKRQTSFKFYPSTRQQARQLMRQFNQLHIQNVSVKLEVLQDQDWQNKWKKDFKPFALTSDLTIVPAWLKENYIFIDSHLAFGTGLHETTRFMTELIKSVKGQFSTFLDIGTGTGILTLAALKYGAKDVTAMDISEDCVTNAKANFALNGVSKYRLFCKDFAKMPAHKTYDLVAANLVSHDLLAMSEKIISRVNKTGYLAISGISLDNFEAVKTKFSKSLNCVKIKKGKTWAALLYKNGV
ncbi:MAG: 50S ribosomal protein L11 methyltransferase [Candidatus Omnitrophica bacterium]|nr:50S ribosomal protein L11 methyltransferase [Candidatus Omnitrophota bacterium]